MVAFVNKSLLRIFDGVNRLKTDPASGQPLVAAMGAQLIDSIANPPPVTCTGIVVFGMGEVSGSGARRAAEMVHDGVLAEGGTIYFTGGVSPVAKDRQNGLGLIRKQTEADISPPVDGEAEGPYMARVFREELEKMGLDWRKIDIRAEDKSRNTQENIRNTAPDDKLGARKHGTLGIVALPYHVLRVMGTWRKEVGDFGVLRPLAAWPEEIGITLTNWQQSPIARFFTADEGKKFLLPTPEASNYAKRGFCLPVDVAYETRKAVHVLREQDSAACDRWLATRVKVMLQNMTP